MVHRVGSYLLRYSPGSRQKEPSFYSVTKNILLASWVYIQLYMCWEPTIAHTVRWYVTMTISYYDEYLLWSVCPVAALGSS